MPGTAQDADTAQLPQSMRPGRRICQTIRLILRKRNGRKHRRKFCCTIATVIAHTVDIKVVSAGTRLYLEEYCLPNIYANIGGESLN